MRTENNTFSLLGAIDYRLIPWRIYVYFVSSDTNPVSIAITVALLKIPCTSPIV